MYIGFNDNVIFIFPLVIVHNRLERRAVCYRDTSSDWPMVSRDDLAQNTGKQTVV